MYLSRLRAVLPQVEFLRFRDVEVRGVAYDSRRTSPGDLFVAVPGTRVNGIRFVSEAVDRGAVAVVAESPPPVATGPDLPVGVVPSARHALAILAHTLHGQPSEMLDVIGITGTNGKTTTAKMVQSILLAAGWSPAYVGTVGYEIGGRLLPAATTTPESADLALLFRQALLAGHDAAVVEVSSHALDQGRIAGTRIGVGAFTNLTRDHQDYHGDMERYFLAKRRLFEALPGRAPAVVNVGDPAGESLAAFARERGGEVITCGAPQADVRAADVSLSLNDSHFRLITPRGATPLRCGVPGMFNVANAVTAAAIGLALGVNLEVIRAGLARLTAVPGRMERIEVPGADLMVVVDYAHTHVALENLLRTTAVLQEAAGARGRLVVVFGCGGDRDPGRRPRMGLVAAKLADRVVVTSDNPRSEEPGSIIHDILKGMPADTAVQVEPDRRRAIRMAVAEAGPGDTVVIAGKGHETYQQFRDVTVPFDDREAARQALRERCGAAARRECLAGSAPSGDADERGWRRGGGG